MGHIVWLASYPKSGNTWLRAFLANLIADRRDPLPLAELARYCEDEALPEHYSALAGRPSAELDFDEITRLRPQVHARIAASHAGTVLVKTHNRAASIDGYPLHNPDVGAAAIYIVRNPLDVAVSMTEHFGLTLDEAIDYLGADNAGTLNDALYVSQSLGAWSQHVASWADQAGPRLLVLRYEDMLEKPGKTLAKAARLVAPTADSARIDRAMKHASFRELSQLERRDGFAERSAKSTKQFFRVGRANQWREVLSRAQVERVVAAHRVQMARFKYVPPGY
ncbi:sulfotransferase domain-containing protein [Chiayiivirga flava]|uniref:Sulfotransferase domain-containing protein n=1 Tax=Chiayiivirga flava TaxID=659595 RepID=A0A7W8D611_9GAMM|nr:hypothetical protein [Chiayiivirga flava]